MRDVATGDPRLPTLRDPDILVYYREDGERLVMGGYERESRPFALGPDGLDAIPADFNGRLLPEELGRLEEIFVNAARRVPAMAEAEIRSFINGPEGFTPDNGFCLGETEVRGFFVAAGFCAHGIAGAGGMGGAMARWVLDGDPGLDLWEMDVRRFGRQYRSPSYTLKRVIENYESYYDIKYPGHERQSGRPLRLTPANAWHASHGAVFGEKSGWERVNWYESNAEAGDQQSATGWAGHHWSPAIEAEHRATREAAGLFHQSSFASFEVSGPGAAELMGAALRQPGGPRGGALSARDLLNARGGVECDFTVTRPGLRDAFGIVTGTAFGQHDLSWIRRHLPEDGSVEVRDVTSAQACFGLWVRGHATSWARSRPSRWTARPSRTSPCARRQSPTCRCGCSGSPSWGSWAGSSTARPSTAPGCGPRCGRPVSRTGWRRADTRRSTRCAPRRATATGARM